MKFIYNALQKDNFWHCGDGNDKNSGVAIIMSNRGVLLYGWLIGDPKNHIIHCDAQITPNHILLQYTPTKLPILDKAIMECVNPFDYSLISKNYNELVSKLFLTQIKVLNADQEVRLWIDDNLILLKSRCTGLIDVNSEIEIIPKFDDREEKNVRLRKSFLKQKPGFHGLLCEHSEDLENENYKQGSCTIIVEGRKLTCVFMKLKLQLNESILFLDDLKNSQNLKLTRYSTISCLPKIYFKKLEFPLHPSSIILHHQFYFLDHILFPKCAINKGGAMIEGEKFVGKTMLMKHLSLYGKVPCLLKDFSKGAKSLPSLVTNFCKAIDDIVTLGPCILVLDHMDRIFQRNNEAHSTECFIFLWSCHIMRIIRYLGRRSIVCVFICENLDSIPDCIKKDSFWKNGIFSITPSTCNGKNLEIQNTSTQLSQVKLFQDLHLTVKPIEWKVLPARESAKKRLERAVLLPLKYPNLFKTNNLKQSGNVLISGVCGSGKTTLACSFIQYLCSLAPDPMIKTFRVSGPEFFSKFIGNNEYYIRNLFKRARIQKPSLIFFEELESIAPVRGRDTSGISDRIVNQLLTEIDGTSSSDGIFIICTSSRPDLIDPALLRSGRISTNIILDHLTSTEVKELRQYYDKTEKAIHFPNDVEKRYPIDIKNLYLEDSNLKKTLNTTFSSKINTPGIARMDTFAM